MSIIALLIAAILAIFAPIDESALQTAERLQTAENVPLGLENRPFAPPGLSDCDEMDFYRLQWGLPDQFSALGWRESNCRNEDGVKTWCCHGYWQMWTSLHLDDHRLAPKMVECGVSGHHDLNSDDPVEKQKQACAARALYDTVGLSAWAL